MKSNIGMKLGVPVRCIYLKGHKLGRSRQPYLGPVDDHDSAQDEARTSRGEELPDLANIRDKRVLCPLGGTALKPHRGLV